MDVFLLFLVRKLMNRVAATTGLKLVHSSVFHKKNWSSADDMANEASQHDEYYAGIFFAAFPAVSVEGLVA